MDAELWRGTTVQDALMTDIANNEERMGGRFGQWASEPGADVAAYEIETGGIICRVSVEVVGKLTS